MQTRTKSNSSGTFGRRAPTRPASADKPAAPGRKFQVRYTWRMNWIAVGILLAAIGSVRDLAAPADMKLIPLTGIDPMLMWLGTILMGVIGLAWLWQGLSNAPALTFNNGEIIGFTLLGTKIIRWADIDRLQLKNDDTYGKELIIHAKRASPSGSFWLNCIPVSLRSVDKSLEEIVDAIRRRRPDLSV